MKVQNLFMTAIFIGASLICTGARADNQPDNSAVNQRDSAPHEMRAQDQSDSKSDVELTRKIRQAVVAQKDLSTYAKNVKIITSKGQVTLKGPVKDMNEKTQIENLAKQVAGDEKVSNKIEVKQ